MDGTELRCPACGYDVAALLGGAGSEAACPECGLRVTAETIRLEARRSAAARRAMTGTLLAMFVLTLAGLLALNGLSPRTQPNAYLALPVLWAVLFIGTGVAGSFVLRRNGRRGRGRGLSMLSALIGVLVWAGWQLFAIVAVGLGNYQP